jgi:hypothetical protein
MTLLRFARTALALALVGWCSACQYAKDRGADFLDQYRIAVGGGSGAGVRASAAGVVETGVMFGMKPNATALGWKYGRGLFFNQLDERLDADQAEIVKVTRVDGLDYSTGSYHSARRSAALLPALFTWTDATPKEYEWLVPEDRDTFDDQHWLWSPTSIRDNRYAQVHAFDFEFSVALGLYFDVGYSPGELVDFLLGILTIDVAGDDGRF